MNKTVPPVPEENRSVKGPGGMPTVMMDNTKGHRDDEKHNIWLRVALSISIGTEARTEYPSLSPASTVCHLRPEAAVW